MTLYITGREGGGKNTDPQSMYYPHRLPIWTNLKWTIPLKINDMGWETE